jgi:hypothetical protein
MQVMLFVFVLAGLMSSRPKHPIKAARLATCPYRGLTPRPAVAELNNEVRLALSSLVSLIPGLESHSQVLIFKLNSVPLACLS